VQQIQIGALQADWLQVKASLEREMGGVTDQAAAAAGSAEPGRAVPLAMLRQGMVAYSELSREYDARRAGYWTQALSVLTVEQHRQLGALEAGVDGRGSGS
jgi:hypothetical protein